MASLDGTYVPKKTRHDKVIKTFGCFFSSISITQSIREKKTLEFNNESGKSSFDKRVHKYGDDFWLTMLKLLS